MKIFILNIFLAIIFKRTIAISLNQSLLFQKYGFNINSIEIDLSEKSIDKIDINTFKGLSNLELLYLEENFIDRLEYGLFSDLLNLKEIWLQSNRIISIDINIFVGLNKLEKVCLNDNPISNMFPASIKPLCDSNPKCSININEKCIKIKPSIF
jgi:Leucine-rich repeat (LRR) protein